jgi:hypothetical protein
MSFNSYSNLSHLDHSNAQYILNCIKKQNQNRYYNTEFSAFPQRWNIIENFLYKISLKFQLQASTFFASVALFDMILAHYTLNSDMMLKVGLCCLSLASKQREKQKEQLKYSDLNLIFQFKNQEHFSKIEKFILQACNFNINIVTSFDMTLSILEMPEFDEITKIREKSVDKSFVYQLLVDLQLQITKNYESNRFTVSALAVALLMLIQEFLGSTSSLPLRVKRIFNCDEAKIRPLCEVLRSWAGCGVKVIKGKVGC